MRWPTHRLDPSSLMSDRRGVAAVEFAIILPVLLLLLLGILQFGLVFVVQNGMTNAAREGARAMAVSDASASCPGIKRTKEELSYWPFFEFQNLDNCDAEGYITAESTSSQAKVTVTIPAKEVAVGDIFGIFGGDITATVTMRKE